MVQKVNSNAQRLNIVLLPQHKNSVIYFTAFYLYKLLFFKSLRFFLETQGLKLFNFYLGYSKTFIYLNIFLYNLNFFSQKKKFIREYVNNKPAEFGSFYYKKTKLFFKASNEILFRSIRNIYFIKLWSLKSNRFLLFNKKTKFYYKNVLFVFLRRLVFLNYKKSTKNLIFKRYYKNFSNFHYSIKTHKMFCLKRKNPQIKKKLNSLINKRSKSLFKFNKNHYYFLFYPTLILSFNLYLFKEKYKCSLNEVNLLAFEDNLAKKATTYSEFWNICRQQYFSSKFIFLNTTPEQANNKTLNDQHNTNTSYNVRRSNSDQHKYHNAVNNKLKNTQLFRKKAIIDSSRRIKFTNRRINNSKLCKNEYSRDAFFNNKLSKNRFAGIRDVKCFKKPDIRYFRKKPSSSAFINNKSTTKVYAAWWHKKKLKNKRSSIINYTNNNLNNNKFYNPSYRNNKFSNSRFNDNSAFNTQSQLKKKHSKLVLLFSIPKIRKLSSLGSINFSSFFFFNKFVK